MYNRNGTYIYFHISVSEVHVMNLQQLRYAVEVAKTGSITAAAKNLYMGQPNLSKNIRELEAELGITLFERTARGVAPTKNGEDFLGYARSIIAQMESLETMFGPHTETGTQLSVCAPRASYVAQAFSRYLGAEGRAPLQVQYRETSAAAVISDVASGTANLGVVRWQAEHAATLDNLLRENALSGEVLWEFSMVVLLHERHPLAALGDIPYHLLGDYPEIVHGDLTPVLPAEQPAQAAGGRAGRIAVFDRGGQFDILRECAGQLYVGAPFPLRSWPSRSWCRSPAAAPRATATALVRRRPGAQRGGSCLHQRAPARDRRAGGRHDLCASSVPFCNNTAHHG